MDILFISPTFSGAGGIGPHAYRVAEKLRENGFNVELMNVPHVPIKNLKNLSFSMFGTLKALSNKKKYDIVHAWNLPSAFIMKKINARKKILSIHGVYSQQIGMLHSKITAKLVSTNEEKVLAWADVLTTDSLTVQSEYKKIGKSFLYIPAPLDSKKFEKVSNNKEKKNQIVYVGRDSYEKGIDILRKIEPKLPIPIKYCTDMEWLDAMNTLRESEILVVPSRIESIPQVIKEAFYLKTPVIATDVGGNHELIKNKETGILIDPENPDQMLNAINELISDNQTKNKLTENAFQFINKNFSWDILMEKYIHLYES